MICYISVADPDPEPDPVGSGAGSGRIRTFFSDPDPTIKSHITRSKSNKLICEQFTFFKIKPANSEKGGRGQGGRGQG